MIRRMLLCVKVGLAAATLQAAEAPRVDFWVAPGGNDANPGTAVQPFRTPARARDAVRSRLASGRDVTVLFRQGRYELQEPLVLSPQDGAAKGRTMTYASAPGETAIFSAAREIKGWRKDAGDRWTAEVPEAKAGTWFFRQLFVDGERATRARWPNDPELARIASTSKDVRSITLNAACPASLAGQDAEIVVYESWAAARAPIASSEGAQINTPDPVGYIGLGPVTACGGMHVLLEHARDFLDQPGEWYLDRKAGAVTYLGKPGDDLARRRVTASRLERVLVLEGAAGKPVRNVRFVGIQFDGAEFPMPEFGYPEIQAGHYGRKWNDQTYVLPAMVDCIYAEGCRFERCRVSQCGGMGIALGIGCRTNTIVGCRIEDVGGTGVVIGYRDMFRRDKDALKMYRPGGLDADWKNPADTPQFNVVENNLIQRCAAVSHGCVGVFAAFSSDTRIAHNEIRDLPYTGISIGFRWDASPTSQKNCIVELNHIHDVMKLLADGGGVYTLGLQPGTVLRGNLIHDVFRNRTAHGRAPNNGFFIDEGSKGMRFEANTVFKASGGPFRFNRSGYGAHTWLDNNFYGKELSYQPGKVGQALVCKDRDAVEAAHSAALEPELLTVSAWVFLESYPTGGDARRWIVGKNGNESERGHYGLIINGKEAGAYLNTGSGPKNPISAVSASAPLALKRWHHLAATLDGRELKVYVDGVGVANAPAAGKRAAGERTLVIGQRPDGGGQFVGMIDEVRVYGRALGEAELKAMAQDPAKSPKTGLAGHWPLEGGQESLAAKLARQAGLQEPYRSWLEGQDGRQKNVTGQAMVDRK